MLTQNDQHSKRNALNLTALGRDVLLTAVALAVLASTPVAGQSLPTVQTVEVTAQQLQHRHRVTGSLQAAKRTELSLQEEGAVRTVRFDIGERVRQGAVIAELDDRRLAASVRESQAAVYRAQAAIAEREAELAQARSDSQKTIELQDRGAATQREMEDDQRELQVAQARLDSARRQLEETEARLSFAKVRLADAKVLAPYDGWVIERHVDTGDWVRPGQPVVTIVSSGSIEARLEVPERLMDAVAGGHGVARAVAIEVTANGKTYHPKTVRKSHVVDRRARTFALIAELDDANGALSAGMSVTAWVPAGPNDEFVTVPVDAVIRSAGESYVLVASPADDGQWSTQKKSVRVLFSTGDRVALAQNHSKSSVTAGDIVVVEGNERLQPGAPIRIARAN